MLIYESAVLVGLASCSAVFAQSPLALSRFANLPPTFDSGAYRCAARGDIDGDLGLLLGNAGSPIGVYINDGNGRFTDESAARLVSPLPLSCASVDLADVDGDGDLDALLGNRMTHTNQAHRSRTAGRCGATPPA